MVKSIHNLSAAFASLQIFSKEKRQMQNDILLIDKEIQTRRLLEITLTANGYIITEASSGKEGLACSITVQPDLIILDLGLTDADAFNIIKKLREWFLKPIIIFSAGNSEEDIITALNNGANDYLTQPFRTDQLLARIHAGLRQKDKPILEIGSLTIDMINQIARKNNEIISLSSMEFSLLALLAINKGRVLTHQFILKKLWGVKYIEQTQYVRIFVTRLRKKIEENQFKPKLIITESEIGYRFG